MGEEGGMKSVYKAFQKNAYPWFLEGVYKLEGITPQRISLVLLASDSADKHVTTQFGGRGGGQ